MRGFRKMNFGFGIGILLLFVIGFVAPRQTPTEEENVNHAYKRGLDHQQHLHQEHHHHHHNHHYHHHHKEHHHHFNRDDKIKNNNHYPSHHHRKSKKRGRVLSPKRGAEEWPHPMNEKADVAASNNHSDAVFELFSRKRREKAENLTAKENISNDTVTVVPSSTASIISTQNAESSTISSTSTTAKSASRHIIPTTTIGHFSSIKESSTRSSISCTKTSDCTNITNSVCSEQKICDCEDPLPVFISSVQECKTSVPLNATCDYEEQCAHAEEYSTCDKIKKMCACTTGYEMKSYPDVGVNCVTKSGSSGSSGVDPAMIGVLAGLALMFVIICVVLRLFSKARFRENRSIFNTPNPRLMNASLFKDSKLLSPSRGERRGSRASMRGPPSRAPSITSVNKDGVGRSPNGSLSKGRRGSTLSTASATGSAAAAGPPGSAKTPSPTSEKKQPPGETAVAIEAVD